MDGDACLALRLERIGRNQEWSPAGDGLYFVFPKVDGARFISGVVSGCMDKGDVLVVNGAKCKLWVPNGGELVFWWFSLSCEHLFPLFRSSEIYLVHSVMEDFKRAKVFHATEPASRLAHRLLAKVHPQLNIEHRSQLLRIAGAILTKEFEEIHSQKVGFIRTEEHVVQVLENLSMPDVLNLPVKELAHRFGYSRRHLNRLFHQYYGVSVGTLKTEVRLSKALALLQDPNAKVIRIAEEAGFNHLSSFNICFKRHFGVNPTEWRKGALPECAHVANLGRGASDCPIASYGLCPWHDRNRDRACHASSPGETGYGPSSGTGTSNGVKKLVPRTIRYSLVLLAYLPMTFAEVFA